MCVKFGRVEIMRCSVVPCNWVIIIEIQRATPAPMVGAKRGVNAT